LELVFLSLGGTRYTLIGSSLVVAFDSHANRDIVACRDICVGPCGGKVDKKTKERQKKKKKFLEGHFFVFVPTRHFSYSSSATL